MFWRINECQLVFKTFDAYNKHVYRKHQSVIDDGVSNDETDSDDGNDDADECTFHYDSDTGAPHDAPVLLWAM